jgi:hypothetical protein
MVTAHRDIDDPEGGCSIAARSAASPCCRPDKPARQQMRSAIRHPRSRKSETFCQQRDLASRFPPAGKTRSRKCKSRAWFRGRADGLGASHRGSAGTVGWLRLGSRGTACESGKKIGELVGDPYSLGDFGQLASSVIDGVFKLIPAGFTRPYVSYAVVRKMLRPFGLAQIRTTLRTLIRRYSFHRRFLHA